MQFINFERVNYERMVERQTFYLRVACKDNALSLPSGC